MSSVPGRSSSRRFLPPDPRVEEPYRFTPKLAVRVGMLGALALAVFAVLLLRLWGLQILAGSQYLRDAQNNQLRTVRVPAPRGPILDREGRVLVWNQPGTAIQLWPADLPKQGRYAMLQRLAGVIAVPISQIADQLQRHAGDPVTPVTVANWVNDKAHEQQVDYLLEHASDFPGVEVAQTTLRQYPRSTLAAQLLGYVGEISAPELKQLSKDGYRAGDRIGQAGVEAAYDSLLRGQPGIAQLRVDSLGRPRSALTLEQQPQVGNAVRLTVDMMLQQTAERALRFSIDLAHRSKNPYADGGAIVALDPRDGSVLALASNPTYDPSVYVGRVDPKKLAPLVDAQAARQANYPTIDRALDGVYPPGSIFKPAVALAALQEHIVSPYQLVSCTPTYTVKAQYGQQVFKNWDPYFSQAITLPEALARSCDTYFYQLGYDFYQLPPDRGHPLQAWAHSFGFGSPTGIDVGPDGSGLLPDPEWRQATYTKKTDPCCWQIDRLWKPGDSIQLAIGQKDLLVTPIQMARFYAMIANGGSLVTPHVFEDVEQPSPRGSLPQVLRRYTASPPQPTGVDPSALAVVKQGLYDATHQTYGTSSGIFSSFPVPIAGKTGTAEKVVQLPDGTSKLLNQSWFCGYGPFDGTDYKGRPPIVVCAIVENGGHGGDTAAPAALQVFEQWFGLHVPPATVFPPDLSR